MTINELKQSLVYDLMTKLDGLVDDVDRHVICRIVTDTINEYLGEE